MTFHSLKVSPFLARRKSLAIARWTNVNQGVKFVTRKHKFGCLMLNLPESLRKQLTDWTVENVPEYHLGPGGIEWTGHVTVKYGFLDGSEETVQALRALLIRNGPIPVKLTGASLFKSGYGKWKNEDGDVLKIDVESPRLRELNAQVSAAFACEDKFADNYQPHVTLCYLNPENSATYEKVQLPFLPCEVLLTEALWSGPDDSKVTIPLSAFGSYGGIFGSKKLDRQGGEEPAIAKDLLKEADFITYPEDVKGSNCGNCQYQEEGVCHHPKLKSQPVTPRNCCAYWDAPGALRDWQTGKKALPNPEEDETPPETTPAPPLETPKQGRHAPASPETGENPPTPPATPLEAPTAAETAPPPAVPKVEAPPTAPKSPETSANKPETPPVKAKSHTVEWSDDVTETHFHEFFGQKITDNQLADLVGAPPKALISIDEIAGGFSIDVSARRFSSMREIYTNDLGQKVCKNVGIAIDEKSPFKGQGAYLFAKQVEALKALGFSYIECNAVGGYYNDKFDRPSGDNGYYTWPRLGYNGKIPDRIWNIIPFEMKKALGSRRDVLALMALPGGKEWWKRNGGIFEAVFDLDDDSLSMEVHRAYMEERRKRDGKSLNSKQASTDNFLSAEDDEILDQIWERFAQTGFNAHRTKTLSSVGELSGGVLVPPSRQGRFARTHRNPQALKALRLRYKALPEHPQPPKSPKPPTPLKPVSPEPTTPKKPDITESISALANQYQQEHGASVEEINDGYCLDFATDLKRKLRGGRVITAYDGHAFIKYRGRYYDAETPTGVSEISQLPYYQRKPEHFRKKRRTTNRGWTKSFPGFHGKASYFATCERDETGHCKPQGGGGSAQTSSPSAGDKQASSLPQTQRGFRKLLNKAREKVASFRNKLDNVTNVPVAKQVKHVLGKVKQQASKLKDKLTARYGPRQARLILLSGMGFDLGVTGITAALGAPLVVPGMSLLGSIPAVVLAEAAFQLGKLGSKALPQSLSDADIQRLAQQVSEKVVRALTEALRTNREDIRRAFGIRGGKALPETPQSHIPEDDTEQFASESTPVAEALPPVRPVETPPVKVPSQRIEETPSQIKLPQIEEYPSEQLRLVNRPELKTPTIEVEWDEETKLAAYQIFGEQLDYSQFAKIAMGPESSKLFVSSPRANGVSLKVRADGFWAARSFYQNSSGQKICVNEQIRIDDDSPFKNQGAYLFAEQVKELRSLGFSAIHCRALGKGKGKGTSSFVGYYVWPRLGYNAEILGESLRQLPAEFKSKLGNNPDILSLMALPGGKEWWRKNGESLDCDFDLRDGSRSMQVLEMYMEERRKRDKKSLDRNPKNKSNWIDIQLSPEDEAALDRVWERISKFGFKKLNSKSLGKRGVKEFLRKKDKLGREICTDNGIRVPCSGPTTHFKQPAQEAPETLPVENPPEQPPQEKPPAPAKKKPTTVKPSKAKITLDPKPVLPPPQEKPQSDKAKRAKANHKMVDKVIQRYSEETNEPRFAKAIGGKSFPDSEPVDVAIESPEGGFEHGVELKTLVDNSNSKLTMDSYSQIRKIVWEKTHGATFHTVVSDDQKVFNAKGEGVHDDSQRKYYYRRGVAGSARVGNMYECKDEAELKKLMEMPEAELPTAAQRTDGKHRIGKWVFFEDALGKGYKNVKTGKVVRAKK